jgi:hypothetical protein
MNLFIRVVDGVPVDHPILEENLKQAFPDIDLNDPLSGFIKFIRVERPKLTPYVKFDPKEPTYEIIDGVCTDVWHTRPMTDEEKLAVQNIVKASWNNLFPSWVFNEDACLFEPPIARPEPAANYRWNESTLSWDMINVQ